MKKLLQVFLLVMVGVISKTHTTNQSNLISIDKVVVIVDGPERRYLICQSELDRVGIDGRLQTVQDAIIEELLFQDAIKHKIPIDDYADRYIRSIKKNHNIDDTEVDKIFEGAGLTPEEGRLKLQKMGANATMIDLKVKARITIALADVEKEYAKNPKYEEAHYQVEVAFVPFFARDLAKQQEQYSFLMDQIDHNELDVQWGAPLWINENDLAEDKKFITHMKTGSISHPQKVANGYEIYRLKDKKDRRLLTLDERYREIVDYLREPKFKEVFDEYVNELYKTASLIFVDDKKSDAQKPC